MHRTSSLVPCLFLLGVLQAAACSSDPGTQTLGAVNNAGASNPSAGATASGGGSAGTSGTVPGAGAGGTLGTAAGSSGSAAGNAGASSGGSPSSAGAAGALNAAGAGNGSAGAGAGGRPSGPSAACGKPFPDPFKTAVEHDMQVKVAAAYDPKYVARKYYTQLPKGYDGNTPVPMVFYGQGCGQSGPENSGFSDVMDADKFLLVQAIPVGGCFEAGKEGHADSPDGPYFDQALAEIEDKYCIDKGKVFVAGWSSGAWLSTYLACTRGNVIRAAGTVAGGLQHDHGTCTGGAAAMMFIGTGDNENGVVDMVNGFDVGTGQSRDIFVKTNGCNATSMAWDPMYASCEIYGSCDSPVVWCPVPGGHGSGNDKLPGAAWKFWGTLK
jgi:pimeloyl-ACP methyl ester carboxylesterase